MNTAPKISVLMAAYNAARYLPEAIRSILNQAYTNFEFIIINDGSTDNTEEIILSFNDLRVVYLKNETNLGLIASLNKGLNAAKGQYIARMDADDVALPSRLGRQIKVFEKDPEIIVSGSDYYLNKNNRLVSVKNINDSDYQKALLLFTPCFCHPTVMMKNIFAENKLQYKSEYKHAEDYKLWTDLAAFGKFANVSSRLLIYRSHSTQVSSKNHETQLVVSKKIREEFYDQLGFHFSKEELHFLHVIGDNTFIRSKELVANIEGVLTGLLVQNSRLGTFNEESFKMAIHKFWLDSCGNTSLGLRAYFLFSSSPLSAIAKTSLNQKMKLFLKCIVRKFK